MATTRTEIRNAVQGKLAESDDFVAFSLTGLLNRQTTIEAEQKDSIWKNRVGFSKRDARSYTELAQKVLGGQALTLNDLDFLRTTNAKGRMRLAQYAVQIDEIMGERQMSFGF